MSHDGQYSITGNPQKLFDLLRGSIDKPVGLSVKSLSNSLLIVTPRAIGREQIMGTEFLIVYCGAIEGSSLRVLFESAPDGKNAYLVNTKEQPQVWLTPE